MSEDPVSLAVIDADAPKVDPSQDRDAQSAPPDAEAEADAISSAPIESEGKKTRKKPKGIVRGSTADYRRKEANRLAAERSRSRQAERRAGLDEAFKKLSEDNNRLAEEIARLERNGEGDGATEERLAEAVSALQTPLNNESGDHVGHEDTHDTMDAEAEAQAHSRTILAALMSDAEINQALGEEWMHHVDAAEVVGADQQSETNGDEITPIDLRADEQTLGAAEKVENEESTQAVASASGAQENDHAVEQYRQHGFAVALHAEMERHLRDDLAATKVAIDQIDKELAVLRGQVSGENANITPYTSSLPESYTSSDPTILTTILSNLDDKISSFSERMSTLRGQATHARQSRLSQIRRLQSLFDGVVVQGPAEEGQAVFDKLAKGVQTRLNEFMDNILSEDTSSFALLPGSRMAAAIAPRRRGRPPRSQPNPKVPVKSSSGRKSKLRQRIKADEVETAQPDLHGSQSGTPIAQAVPEETTAELPSTTPHVEAPAVEVAEPAEAVDAGLESAQETDIQPELTTEQIISQLTHDEQDLHELLRSHAQAEYDAQQQAQVEEITLPEHFESNGDSSNIDQASSSNIDPALAQSLDETQTFGTGPRGSCDICSRTQTTVWRKLHLPDRDLHVCNACGMYHIKTGQLRPRELWGDGKLIRKRRKSTHPRARKSDVKRPRIDGEPDDDEMGDEQVLEGHVADGDVVGHDDFRATLGMEGLDHIITGFANQSAEEVAQDVANVFGTVE